MHSNKNIKLLALIIMPFIGFIVAHCLIKYHPDSICIWKMFFHTDCLGCGITRAFYSLFKLDFVSAWNYNPRIYIIVPILLYVWIKELYKTIKSAKN